jgi:hypothetical protein
MLEYHQIANIFPMMDEVTFRGFQSDIKEHGLQEKVIWLYEGKILDGRNRYRACTALSVAYDTQTYTGDDPVAFVISRNLHRRHLNESQRSMVGARVADLDHGGDRKSHKEDQDANLRLDEPLQVTVPWLDDPEPTSPPKSKKRKPDGVKQETAAALLMTHRCS